MGDDDGNLPAARQACDDAYEAYTAYALWWTSFAAYLIAMGLTLFAHFSKDLCGCHHKFDQKVFRLFVGSALSSSGRMIIQSPSRVCAATRSRSTTRPRKSRTRAWHAALASGPI